MAGPGPGPGPGGAVLCIRNEPLDRLRLVREAVEGEGLTLVVLDAFDPAVRWPDLRDLAGVVVLGGAMNVDQTDRYPFLARQRELLREAVAREVPVLGICLGAQLLARALGEPVVRAPAPEIGFHPLRLTEPGRGDPVVSAFVAGGPAFQWHTDTFGVPPGATLLAEGDRIPVQAFSVARAWAVQFHPEVTAEELEAWIDAEGEGFEERWGRPAEDLRSEIRRLLPEHRERGLELLRRFARVAAGCA